MEKILTWQYRLSLKSLRSLRLLGLKSMSHFQSPSWNLNTTRVSLECLVRSVPLLLTSMDIQPEPQVHLLLPLSPIGSSASPRVILSLRTASPSTQSCLIRSRSLLRATRVSPIEAQNISIGVVKAQRRAFGEFVCQPDQNDRDDHHVGESDPRISLTTLAFQ